MTKIVQLNNESFRGKKKMPESFRVAHTQKHGGIHLAKGDSNFKDFSRPHL